MWVQEMVSGFLACFDDVGNMLWITHDAMTGAIGYPEDRPVLDKQGNIYFKAGCMSGGL